VTVFNVPDPSSSYHEGIRQSYQHRIDDLATVAFDKRKPAAGPRAMAEMARLKQEADEFCKFFGIRKRVKVPASLKDHEDKIRRAERAEQRRREKAQREYEEETRERMEAWLAGENVDPPQVQFDRMRVVDNEIQTTKHATVPVADVVRIAPLVLKTIYAGKHWKSNGQQIKVGPYQLDAITSDGTVLVGCHRFQRAEIERVAQLLKIEE